MSPRLDSEVQKSLYCGSLPSLLATLNNIRILSWKRRPVASPKFFEAKLCFIFAGTDFTHSKFGPGLQHHNVNQPKVDELGSESASANPLDQNIKQLMQDVFMRFCFKGNTI